MRALEDSSGRIATFDTAEPYPVGDLTNLSLKIDENFSPNGHAVAGVLYLTGDDANVTIGGPGELHMHWEDPDMNTVWGVAFDVDGKRSHLTVNAPVDLFFDDGNGPLGAFERNPLSMNVADASSSVTISGNVRGGFASITKGGEGTLNVTGDNSQMSSGITLNQGFLNLGSDDAIGGTGGTPGVAGFEVTGGRLVLNGGTVRAIDTALPPPHAWKSA